MRRVALAAALAAALGAWGAPATAEDAPPPLRLTLGALALRPTIATRSPQALAAYLAPKLAEAGVSGVDVRFARDSDELSAFYRDGRVDFSSDTPFAALELVRRGGAEILLAEQRQGTLTYHTLIFADRGGPVKRLQDLKGRVIAFEDDHSTSAFMLPASELLRAGLPLKRLALPSLQPDPAAVNYLFVGPDRQIPQAVLSGRADAGGFSNLNWAELEKDSPRDAQRLTVLATSPAVLRSALLARAALPAELKERLRAVLLVMDRDPDGLAALKAYRGLDRFAPLEGEAAAALNVAAGRMAIIRQMTAAQP